MRPRIGRYWLIAGLVAMMVTGDVCADDPDAAIPSYQDARANFETERKGAPSAPQISAADRSVMQRAGADLARQMPNPGLRVGETAPEFSLPNAFGETVTLSNQLRQGPVVLTFYRGAWCPYCNLQMKTLHQSVAQFERYGAQVIAITPQKPDKSAAQVKKDAYPFEILSDLDSAVMQAYRLYFELPPDLIDVYKRNFKLDLTEFNGPGRNVLPVPGTFVLDRQGIVRAAFATTDYKERMEPAAIIAALAELRDERAR